MVALHFGTQSPDPSDERVNVLSLVFLNIVLSPVICVFASAKVETGVTILMFPSAGKTGPSHWPVTLTVCRFSTIFEVVSVCTC